MPAVHSRKQTKAAFVRDLPTDLPAKQVVEKAKAAGLTFSEAYVYSVRAAAKRKRSRRSGQAVRATNGAAGAEALLRVVAAEIGLKEAIRILQAERERVLAILTP